MREISNFLIPVLVVIFLSACENKYKIEPGTDFYLLAKALAIKYEALHPDSNLVIVKSKNDEITANELLHVVSENEGNKIQNWRNFKPPQIKENARLRAEALLLKKEMLRRAKRYRISVTETEVDSAFKAEYTGINKTERQYLNELNTLNIKLDVVKDGLKDKLIMARFLNKVLADELQVSEEEILKAYKNTRIISFRHILLGTTDNTEAEKSKVRKKMEGILRKLRRGADFSKMVRENSQDAASVENGGLYQDRPFGGLDSAFAVAAFATPVGEISDIVESSYGYHIIKVIDRKNEDQPLDEIKADLKSAIVRSKRTNASEQYLADLKKEIEFEVVN